MTESIEAVNSPDAQQAEDPTNESKATSTDAQQQKRTLLERLHRWVTADPVMGFVFLAVFAGLLCGQAILTYRALCKVERQRDIALARQWAAEGQLEFDDTSTDLFISAALGIESMRLIPTGEGSQLLRQSISSLPHQVTRMQHDYEISAVAFSPDGRWIASTGCEEYAFSMPTCVSGTARVWEAATGVEVARMQSNGSVAAIAFSPDGQWVVSAGCDEYDRFMTHCVSGTARVWEAATGTETARMQYDGSVNAVTFSPDGRRIVSAGCDDYEYDRFMAYCVSSTARVWETATGVEVARVRHDATVSTVAFSPDGQWVASAGCDEYNDEYEHEYNYINEYNCVSGTARVWEAATGVEVAHVQHDATVFAMAFSPNGRWVVSGDWDGTARVWEAATGAEITRIQHDGSVKAVAFSPDSQWIISGGQDGTARVWEAATGTEVARMQHDGSVNAVAFSPDGKWVISGGWDGTARVWEAATGAEVTRMQHAGWINTVAFSPDGKWAVSGGWDGTAWVWEATTETEIAHVLQHDGWVNAVAFSPNGKWIVSGSNDDTARVWEAATGKEVTRMQHNGPVEAVAFSADDQWVISEDWDGTARVWEAATGKEVTSTEHSAGANTAAFNPDGRWVVGEGENDTTRVWEAATGEEVARMQYNGSVKAVAFSPDGRWVASGSWDDTARVWEAATGKEVARMQHDRPVEAVAFSPDGRWIVSGSWDDTARVWPWRPEDLIAEACTRLPRNLTRGEWAYYMGDKPYRATCPNLPFPEE